MAGLGLLDRVHGKRADGVGHAVMVGARHRHSITVTRGSRGSGRRSWCVHEDLSGCAVG
jgi:hypothetical protein